MSHQKALFIVDGKKPNKKDDKNPKQGQKNPKAENENPEIISSKRNAPKTPSKTVPSVPPGPPGGRREIKAS
jgi:hypothetical protein